MARQRENLGDRVKLLADVQISPRTVAFLRSLGHDVVRVPEILPATAPDDLIVKVAREGGRAILTQDLDFTSIVALSGQCAPSIISLRLSSARVDLVNAMLRATLPIVEREVVIGSLVTIEDGRIRMRPLPVV